MTWVYDGSLEGFLTTVVESYERKRLPDAIVRVMPEETLFNDTEVIFTRDDAAAKLLEALRTKFPDTAFERLFHGFLCDDQPVERDLLLYIRLGFKEIVLLDQLSHPVVFAVEQYQKRVLSTLHKMHAFTRFEVLSDNTLYAQIDPPRNVLPLMGRHFRKRFSKERFIIHDLMRRKALIYDTRNIALESVHSFEIPDYHDDEAAFQKLWKRFFDQIAIEERLNSDLQRQHVPLLYRGHMSEFDTPHAPAAIISGKKPPLKPSGD